MYHTTLQMYFHAMNATITINDVTYFPHKAQYHFLHLALSEALMLSTSAMPASRFIDAYNELMKYDGRTKCSKMEREFQVVVLTGNFYLDTTNLKVIPFSVLTNLVLYNTGNDYALIMFSALKTWRKEVTGPFYDVIKIRHTVNH